MLSSQVVGDSEGLFVGDEVRLRVGGSVGTPEGSFLGLSDGLLVGLNVGQIETVSKNVVEWGKTKFVLVRIFSGHRNARYAV